MTEADDAVLERLMERHGRTYCEELGIDIASGTPSPLFRWLVASILFSARIGADVAAKAARALSDAGWRTPGTMARSTWEERVRVLDRSGYARYDESTARMLGEDVALVEERYHGDLRRLREAAARDPAQERRLLKVFKGIGEVGADIFFREVQGIWDEHHPFLDARGRETAKALGLRDDPATLAQRVGKADFPRLTAALQRARLAGDVEAIRTGG